MVLSILRMSSHAVISSTGHRRIHYAERWLENRAAAEEVLIVGGTLDGASELMRKAAKKKGAAFGWHRFTLPQLAFAVASPILAASGLTPLSRIGAGALVERLVHRINNDGRIGRYQPVALTPGFSRALAGVIAELRLARISLDAMRASVPDLESLNHAYEVELREAGLSDWPGVLALASKAASAASGNRPHLIGLPMLLLGVPVRNEAEVVFVDLLTAAASEVLATVPTADQATLRRLRDRLRAQIEDLDEVFVGDDSGASLTSASALTNLQRRLFKEEARPIQAKPDDTVEVFSAPGEGRECVEIARRILSIARRGVPFDQIAVLLRSPEGYRAYLEEAFNPPDALSVRFSNAPPMACQPGDSRSTFHQHPIATEKSLSRQSTPRGA